MESTNYTNCTELAGDRERSVSSEGRVYFRKLSYRLPGCAQKVHRILGPGSPEAVYHNAFCRELMNEKIPFESEKVVEVFYDGFLCGEFRMDIVVENKIVLELKAVEHLTDEHVAHALSYLKATGLKLAILINFGRKSLETRRVVL